MNQKFPLVILILFISLLKANGQCASAPSQVSDLNLSIESGGVAVTWSSVAGTDIKYLVVGKDGSETSFTPTDGVEYISGASLNFSAATSIGGDGSKLLANTTSTNLSISGLTLGNTYHVTVFAFCDNGEFYEDTITTNQNSDSILYEISYCSINSNSPSNVDINTVSTSTGFGPFSGGGTETNEYYNYTAEGPIEAFVDNSFDLTINATSPALNSAQMIVWIDFNQDGDFNDLGEEFDFGQVFSNSTADYTESITVPETATLGETRLRAVIREGLTDPSSCGAQNDIEAEDYTVLISPINSSNIADMPTENAADATLTANEQTIDFGGVGSGSGFEALYFEIIDDNTKADGLDTEVNQMRIFAGDNNTFDWSGIDLNKVIITYSDNSDFSSPSTISLSSSDILFIGESFVFDLSGANTLLVSENTNKYVKINLFLKETLPIDSDQKVFQAKINLSGHDFTTTDGSNIFLTEINSGSDIVGPEFTIDVEASQLVFDGLLTEYYVNIAFADINVQAQDPNGNIDTDYANEITLSSNDLNAVEISNSATTAVFASAGEAVFSNIFYDETTTTETIAASDGTLTSGSSSSFDVIEVDADSQITSPLTQVSSNTIVAADHTTSGTPVEVISFDVEDLGTADNFPTLITEITLNAAATNTANLATSINSVSISDGVLTYTPDNITINAGQIILDYSSNSIELSNASSLTLTASIFLNELGIEDNSVISLEIDTASHGFLTSNQGSAFEESQSNGLISGADITIDVVASSLAFQEQPSNTLVNQTMIPPVIVVAVDLNSNIDKDYTQNITLTTSGPSAISGASTLTLQAIAGVASFEDLVYTNIGVGNSLSAEDDSTPSTLTSLSSDLFEITNTVSETSLVSNPGTQIDNQIIEAASFTSSTETFEALNFNVSDLGIDGLSTLVSEMSFTPSASNTADWSDHISGILISDGNTTFTPDNTTITDTEISIEFNSPLVVNDSSSENYTALVYLNTSTIEDTSILSFEIATTNTGFIASNSGSRFDNPYVSSSITGPEITVNVVASELGFSLQPSDALVFESMSAVNVSLTDVNGNLDISSSTQVSITSTGSLSGSTVSSISNNGIAVFNSIVHTLAGTGLTLEATSIDLSSATSNSFNITDEILIAIQDWDASTPEWTFTTSETTFDNTWGVGGYFDEIDISSATPVSFGDFTDGIFGANFLENNAIPGLATLDFNAIDISTYENVNLSFDYAFINYDDPSDRLTYELIYDGVSEGVVDLFDGSTPSNDSDVGNISLSIPNTVDEIELIIGFENDAADEYAGVDNVRLTGNRLSINYVYNGTSWSPNTPEGNSTVQDNLSIQAGSVTLSSNVFCNDLDIDTGASLTINDDLVINGDLTNDGTLDASNANFNFSGSVLQTLTSATEVDIQNIVLSNSNNLTLDANITLQHSVRINAGSIAMAVNDSLTLASNASGTAVIGQIANGSTISGGIIIEQYIPSSNRAFRYLSSPISTTTSINDNWQEGQTNNSGEIGNYNLVWDDYVTAGFNNNSNPGYGTHITGANTGSNGLDETLTGNSSLFRWENEFQQWNSISNTQTNNFTSGEAYVMLIRGDRATSLMSNSIVGSATTLRIKDNASNLSYGDTDVASSNLNNDFIESWNLIGNVYQSKVDMKQVLDNASGIQNSFYYVYDPTLNTSGGYVTVDLTSLDGSPTPSSNQDKFLQPGQACFIQNTSLTPSVTFRENYKLNEQAVDLVKSASSNTQISEINVELFNAEEDNHILDGTKIVFKNEYSNEVNYEDAIKFWNNDESMSFINNDNYLSIDKRNSYNENTEAQLFMYNYRANAYTFKIAINNIDNAKLYDNYLDTYTNLNNGNNTVNFEVDPSIPSSVDEYRFKIVFNQETLSNTEFTDSSINDLKIYPNPNSGDQVMFDTTLDLKDYQLKLIDIQGRVIVDRKLKQNSFKINFKINPGIYLIHLSNTKVEITRKLIIK